MTAVALALVVHLAALVAAWLLPWSREDLAIARSLTTRLGRAARRRPSPATEVLVELP